MYLFMKEKKGRSKDELFTKVLRNYGDYFSIYEWIYDTNRYNDAFCTASYNVSIAWDDDYEFCLSYLHPQFKEKTNE